MYDTVKNEGSSYLEPIICDVRVPIKQDTWGQSYKSHRGSVTFDVVESNRVKKLILAAAIYQKIELPYRFRLTIGEIVYEKKHIKTVKLAGFYLSGIDALKVQAQFSPWKTQAPPETFLDEDEIVMSEEFSQQCYFVVHRSGEEFHAEWNLKENFDICQNPQNYFGIQWQIIDFTR